MAQTRLGAFAPGGDASGLTDFAFVGGLGIMLALALGFMSGRYRTLAEGHWVWVWAGISLLLVLVVLVTGQRFRGAVFGAGFITPTELLKVTSSSSPPPISIARPRPSASGPSMA